MQAKLDVEFPILARLPVFRNETLQRVGVEVPAVRHQQPLEAAIRATGEEIEGAAARGLTETSDAGHAL